MEGLKKLLAKYGTCKYFHLGILILAVLLCYSRTLGSYFLADDFGEIKYVSKIAGGEWDRFWSNFTGNFMQIHTMAVYRPWLLITLLVDYFVWGTNAFGYYLSNLAHYVICVAFIYLLIRGQTDYWGDIRSACAAFFSALIFALSPLHPESVSWVVGRVDIVCLAYFMGSLLALHYYLRQGKKLFLVLSAVAFWIAILTKEMAVGLPILAVAMTFLWGERKSWKPVSLLFLGSLVLYFVIRYLALGTLGGGYTGSIGANQLSALLAKWTDTGTLERMFFPIKISYGTSFAHLKTMLSAAYLSIFVLVCLRLLIASWPRKWMFFLFLWLGLCLVPIYQLYGLGFDLEGARFLFFATAPMSMFAPIILFAPLKDGAPSGLAGVNKKLACASLVVLSFLTALHGKLAYKNNVGWVQAGAQTRAMGKEIEKLALETEEGKRIGVMGIPAEHEGAHLILNAITFLFYLQPPFSKELTDRVCTFGAKYYGDTSKLDLGFFKNVAASNNGFYKWSWKDKKLMPLKVAVPALSVPLMNLSAEAFPDVDGESRFFIRALNVVPSSFDFLDLYLSDVQLKELEKNKQYPIHLFFKGKDSENRALVTVMDYVTLPGKVRIPISAYWRWQTDGNIEEIVVKPPIRSMNATKADLLSYGHGAPSITMLNAKDNKDLKWSSYGTHWVEKGGLYKLTADSKNLSISNLLPQPISVEFQISKPNFFFANAQAGQDSESMVETRLKAKLKNGSAEISLPESALATEGFRQVRVRCLDGSGSQSPIEAYSYPLTLEIVCNSSK